MTLTRRHIALTATAVLVVAIATLGAWTLARRGATVAARSPAVARMRDTRDSHDMPGMSMPVSDTGSVHLSAMQLRQFGITFATAERRRIGSERRTTGVVAVDETRVVEVAPRFGGFVERVRADFTGRRVQRGERLLEIYSPEIFAALQELVVARQLARGVTTAIPGTSAGSSDLVGAARQRLQLLGVGDEIIDATIASGHAPRTVIVRAPTSGFVMEKRVTAGQAVTAGQTLYTIADLSGIWVNIDVREADAGAIRVGTPADVAIAALMNRPLRGVVSYVQPVVRPETRTVTARISVGNSTAQLKPGMFATVVLHPPGHDALTVPNAALVRTGDRTVVFVDVGDGALIPQDVRTGAVSDDYTEILSGLAAGARVVTPAQFLLDSESNLGEVMRSMLGQGAAAARSMESMPGMEPSPR